MFQAASKPGNNEGGNMEHKITPLRKIIRYAAVGIGFGSFFLMLLTAIAPGWIPLNRLSILTMFVMSALIGELTFLLDDGYPWSYLAHFALTFALTIAWVLANGWTFRQIPGGLGSIAATFVGIYVAIWLVVITDMKIDVGRMNRKLRESR
ncbi:DUF3021 domain-containing protein [Bifidobacterium sp. ESL0690]|uniref:DUF3021 domain-containing protein n=1 Tax=Bifidobacterium sp. ESL0690 TaxID=2983214 RepID=UPI0023FA4167|nr:DUF3021 domain-containing protein [Bifidobacterium sp. ESL0690]WEV46557.1 DUF3021 domain-containing protein [Bifidobacterium sp. ESL0690]